MKESDLNPLSTSEITTMFNVQLKPLSQPQITAMAQLQKTFQSLNHQMEMIHQMTIPFKSFTKFANSRHWHIQPKFQEIHKVTKSIRFNREILDSISYTDLFELYSTYVQESAILDSDPTETASSEIADSLPLETKETLTSSPIFNFDFLSDISNEKKLDFFMWLISIIITIGCTAVAHFDASQAHQDFLIQQSTSQNSNPTTSNQPNDDK